MSRLERGNTTRRSRPRGGMRTAAATSPPRVSHRRQGRTWLPIAGNLPAHGPVKVIREDPKNPRLLYAGTEFGAFLSLDGGTRWTKLDLPTVAVDDIVVHPRDHDLVLATHGKSLFILDDVTPLQALTPRSGPGFYPRATPATASTRCGW